MAAINNIEIFGLVCRETNPPVINIKRGKDKQAQIMTFTPPVRNVSIHDINLVLLRKKERLCDNISVVNTCPPVKLSHISLPPQLHVRLFFLPEMSVDLTRKVSHLIIYSVTSQ
jgi:hypothetical protein